jgi:predicted amidohydrolase YtcJ
VNSKALAIADITSSTPDPNDGHIVKEAGVFKEYYWTTQVM